MPQIFSPERIPVSNLTGINEKNIQDFIAEDPSILGLGDLVLKDKERIQPKAGRLDLLMQDPETNRRYEIEIQLGKTDESHIIRTIEYWDIERKRFPQYDHCAVIIAEDITSRFLNVIGLFNGFIPLIALQMGTYKMGDGIGLVFTKVVDEMRMGLDEDDEEIQEPTDREYWLKIASDNSVKMADEILAIINSFKPGHELKYNKFYIGIAKDRQTKNFVIFRPKRNHMRLEFKLPKTIEVDQIINSSDIDNMDYDSRHGNYRLRLTKEDISGNKDLLKMLLEKAESNFSL